MSPLSSKQRAQLRSMAHSLKPVVHVGTGGVTEAVLTSLEEAFNTRELLKVKVLEGAPEKAKPTARQIAEAMEGVEIAQTIGRTVVLYRPHPDQPEIVLD